MSFREIVRTDAEIDAMLNKANEIIEFGVARDEGQEHYAQGVMNAIMWLIEPDEDDPLEV